MKLRRVVLVLLLILLVVQVRRFFVAAEDAYISFRYAENLAEGRGLVFNAGERVEGYTNFLWVVLLAGARCMGAPIPETSQWLGLLLAIGTVLLSADLGRRICPGSWSSGLLAALLVAANPGVAAWAGAGMEVSLFSFLALLMARMWSSERQAGKLPWKWPLAGCLAGMARPEGVLLFLVALAIWSAFPPSRNESFMSRTVRPLAIFLAPGVPYFLWRWSYYGELLPNTFAAKSGLDALVVEHGLKYLLGFLRDSGGAWLALGALLAVGSGGATIALLLSQSLLFTLYVVLIGGDDYAYHRFLVPVAVLLAPACEVGYRRVWGVFVRLVRLAPIPRNLLAGVFIASLAGAVSFGSFEGVSYQKFQGAAEANERRRPIGVWLRDHAPRTALVALNPVGIIPYFSGLASLDQLGLTDAHIARKGKRVTNPVLYGHNRYDSDYVLSRRPDILILGQAVILDIDPALPNLRNPGPTKFSIVAPAVARDLFAFPADDATWRSPLFRRRYRPNIVRIGEGFFYYFALDQRATSLQDRISSGAATAKEHAEMADLLRDKGEVGLALEEAHKAAGMDPAFAQLFSETEAAYRLAARQVEAREAFSDPLRRMGEDLAKGDVASAERDLLEGLQKSPKDAVLLLNLGVLYERTSRFDDAERSYLHAVAVRADYADAWANLGTLQARKGDLNEAKKSWERAVSLDPDSPARENLRVLSSRNR